MFFICWLLEQWNQIRYMPAFPIEGHDYIAEDEAGTILVCKRCNHKSIGWRK